MITEEAGKELEKQQYRLVGSHSAVKVCGWTKNMLRNQGSCYKHKFYGIRSTQCLQMTTCFVCANRCVFCWRGYKSDFSLEWKWPMDDPKFIFENAKIAQGKLLEGFGGNPKVNQELYQESKTIRHVALSLTGEPIMYPRLNEFIDLCNKDHVSTFLVTNGLYPDAIKKLAPVTQIYLSVDAPNRKLLKEIGRPLLADFFERFNASVEAISNIKQRTVIRITAIKNLNMIEPENYAKIIKRANVDFVEVKAYMHVGASRDNLERENMPFHEEVVDFAKEVAKFLPDYEVMSEHIPSRVVLIAKKTFKADGKWNTWIDFDKFNTLSNSEEDFPTEQFSATMPDENVGISGKGTIDSSKFIEQ